MTGAPTFESICQGPQFNASTCPQHTAAALPDFTRTLISTYIGQKIQSNTIQLQADLTKRITARIGYLYGDRVITKDRKSTRLNSSHGYISYAVFCLKKQNIHILPRILLELLESERDAPLRGVHVQHDGLDFIARLYDLRGMLHPFRPRHFADMDMAS